MAEMTSMRLDSLSISVGKGRESLMNDDNQSQCPILFHYSQLNAPRSFINFRSAVNLSMHIPLLISADMSEQISIPNF